MDKHVFMRTATDPAQLPSTRQDAIKRLVDNALAQVSAMERRGAYNEIPPKILYIQGMLAEYGLFLLSLEKQQADNKG